MSFPTVSGDAVDGLLMREAQICLGTALANSTYKFFLTGTATPANVYQDGALTTPFPITGTVTADNFGRFPPIYTDTSIIYKVQFFDSGNNLKWTVDPYTPPLATVGTSSKVAFGMIIAPTGEVTIPAPNTGGTGISLTLVAGELGSAPLQISSTLPGNSALIINSSATTGAQTATFTATNKPGTAASAPAGWLPITCDGVQYYTPIWHGNPFTPYVANPSAIGEVIIASSVTFGGNGLTAAVGGTASPSNWFIPSRTGVGAGYFINITKTGGLSGLAFSAAQGVWTNITSGGLAINSNAQAQITGTYNLSTSVSGTPVVASGTITLANNNGIQSPAINGATPLVLAGNGTSTLNGVGASNWFLPTTANTGASYWINITRTGGTSGYNFAAAQGAWTNITNGGLSIGVSGTGATTFSVSGTYLIASDSGGVNRLGSGTITLNGSNVQSPNWSGTTPLVLVGNGSTTLNGVSTSNWYSPTSSNVGSGFWINITRTGGTAGVNFAAAQGSWTNITNSGLSIGMTGFSGDVGTVTVNGTYQISSSSSGTPVLGSGTISLSLSGLTTTRTYSTAVNGATETIPTGATNCVAELWGGTGGGASANVIGPGNPGGGGGSSGYSRTALAVTAGNTLTYTIGAPGTGNQGVGNQPGGNGAASSISSGTQTITTMTAPGGAGGGASGLGGAGGSVGTGGTQANSAGNTGGTPSGNTGGVGAAGVTGVNGSGQSGGNGANLGGVNGMPGNPGRAVFKYS